MDDIQLKHNLDMLIENYLYDRIVAIEGKDIPKEKKELEITELYDKFFKEYKDFYKIVDVDELIAKVEDVKTRKYQIEHSDELDDMEI